MLLEDLLSQSQSAGVLSQEQCELLRKFKCEGFEANELAGLNTGTTTNAVQMRLKRSVKKLRRMASEPVAQPAEPKQSKKSSIQATIFPDSMAISNK